MPGTGRGLVAVGAALLIAGTPAHAHGDLHEKIADLTRQIAADPTPELRFQRADLQLSHGDPAATLTDLNWLDRNASGQFATAPLRGRALHLLNSHQAALEVLDGFLETHPDASRVFVTRARVHAALGQTKAAIRDYQAALALTPEPEPDLILEAADALATEDPAAAIALLDPNLTRLGPVPALADRILELETLTKRWDAALARLTTLQAASTRPEPWLARRARILTQAGRHAEAGQTWRQLLTRIAALPVPQQQSSTMSGLIHEARAGLAPDPVPDSIK